LNLPARAELKRALPQARITMLVSPELAPLLEGVPEVDEALIFRDGPRALWWWRAGTLARVLRTRRFTAAIVSNPRKDLHLAVRMAGIPRRIGYDRKWAWLLTERIPDRKSLGDRHEVEYNLELVRALGLPASTQPQWRLPRFEREQGQVGELLAQQGITPSDSFIAIHPWTSNPLKQWPVERYRTLIREAAQRLPVRLVVIGGPQERAQVSQVLPDHAPAADLVGRLSLRQLAALLQRCRLLVSNDSGPVHLAAAAGARTLVLFGAASPGTGPQRWGPWGGGHRVIAKRDMESISVDEVLEAMKACIG
jgi:ADP-heptose:LPS heptosyltransferase